MAIGSFLLLGAASLGVARADHTNEDARATSAKLEAILHPHKPKLKPKVAAVEAPAPGANVTAGANAATSALAPAGASPRREHLDPLVSLIVHGLAFPFDAGARAAYWRDLPRGAAELDTHLRRLDAALAREARSPVRHTK